MNCSLRSPSVRRLLRASALGLAMAATMLPSFSQDKNSGGIFSCTDSRGHRLTSDRPIAECLDREQRELSNSATVKRVLPPSYTAEERAQLEIKRRAEEAEQARIREEKRREKALLIRYPSRASHDKERTEALAQVDNVIDAVKRRIVELDRQRQDIDLELEFYQNDPKKAPPWLQRKLEDNVQQIQVQNRFLNEQNQEKQRVNARFDEELDKLRQLWARR